MQRLLWPAALLLALLIPWPVWADSEPPLSLDSYRQVIDQARGLVERGETAQAADLLAGIVAVQLPAGETMPVDHGWFVRTLRADGPDQEAVAARLAALRHELDAWPSASPAPDAFERLGDVLARPEFQPGRSEITSPLNDWLQRLLDALPRLPALPWLGNGLLIGGLVVLVAVVAYLAAGLWSSFVAHAEADEPGSGAACLTTGQALTHSREMAQAGNYRAAVRLLYLSTLLLLEERNLLRYNRTLTNREYLRQVADHPALAGALRPVVDTFDEVWYGQVEPDAAHYQAYARQVDRVREAAG